MGTEALHPDGMFLQGLLVMQNGIYGMRAHIQDFVARDAVGGDVTHWNLLLGHMVSLRYFRRSSFSQSASSGINCTITFPRTGSSIASFKKLHNNQQTTHRPDMAGFPSAADPLLMNCLFCCL